MKERIAYIDSMKGLAILLMVMGHVIANQFPSSQEALNAAPRSAMFLFRFIYSFHMPLLMFCSGLFALSIEEYTFNNIGTTIWKRTKSLLIPFFVYASINICVHFLNYWYLWMLFQFIVVVLLIDWICSMLPKYKKTISTFVIVALALLVHLYYHKFYFLENLPLFDVGHWNQFLFFCIGVICARYDLCTKWFSKNWIYTLFLVLFGFLTYWCTIMGNHIPKQSITWCLIPISAIVACVYLFKEGLSGASKAELWLQKLGKHSLEVYILHLFFLPRTYQIGEYALRLANADGGGRTVFFVQFVSSLLLSIIIIYMCYMVMNIINKSSLLSLLLLGRKSEKHAV